MFRIPQVSRQRLVDERIVREAEELGNDFRKFVEAAWPIVEPGAQFLPGIHIDAITEHLQACAEGQISKLLINVQPRSGKSTIVSVLYPAWLWIRWPTERMLFGSYALTLAMSDSTKTRRMVKTEWYQKRWPHVVLTDDQDTKSAFENTHTGKRQITSVGGPTTGLGGTHLILDDPHNAQQAESAIVRETTIQWVREAWSTRMNPGRGVQIVVMQRLHQNDVSGYYLSEGGWDHLCLPTEYEGEKKVTSIGWVDPRTQPGDLLWPERFATPRGQKDLASLKKTLGSVGVAGQLQQRPVPRGGSTFKREWLRFWFHDDGPSPDPVCYPKPDGTFFECEQKVLGQLNFGTLLHSWDLAFKGGEKNDFVVGQTWARGHKDRKADHYLLDQIRGNFDFVETVAEVRKLAGRWEPGTILVEEKANGAAVISSLKGEVPSIVPVNPQGGKQSRASAIAPMFEAGNIWLPHPRMPGYEWVQAYIDELTMFPRGANDDQVDATTQALIRMRSKVIEDIDMAPSIAAGSRASPWTA